jgi:putative endonuclease
MHHVYIIKSLKTGKFYCGETPDVLARLAFHNDIQKNTNSTKTGIPWEVFWKFEVSDRALARKIESHIKRMKTTKYYEDLKRYPEISNKLVLKYSK